MNPVHRETVRVRASEIGPGGAMHLPALLDLFQESAGNNAAALGWGSDTLLAAGRTWILSRLHLRLRALPSWREEVAVETWPSGILRVFALREFHATGANGRLLAEATSAWLLVDVESRRPLRQPPEIADIAKASPPRVIRDSFDPLPAPGDGAGASGSPFRVTRYDIDLNEHANNVTILTALLSALPSAPALPLAIEADFRGEAFEGDVLLSRVEERASAMHIRLSRESDGKEVARAVVGSAPETR